MKRCALCYVTTYFKKMKKTKVTRKFLLDLANRIYDPKTRKFLRLCNGVLQNGPDPTNKKRSMHCGLGEAYFVLTGNEPKDDYISTADVIDLIVERSGLKAIADLRYEQAKKDVRIMDVPRSIKSNLIYEIDESYRKKEFSEDVLEFRGLISDVVGVNDDKNVSADHCTYDMFRRRASRVAKMYRDAAKLLPE